MNANAARKSANTNWREIARPSSLSVQPGSAASRSRTWCAASGVLGIDGQRAAADLVALEAFEQRLEVAFAEALVVLALDELEEHRPQQRLGEDLQQQPLVAA